MQRVSLIVATKDRPSDLRKMLESLRCQTVRPDEILIVDASLQTVEPLLADFSELTMRYIRHWPPSAAAQRNAGIRACNDTATLIGFADDDITFEPQAFEDMIAFWGDAAPDLLGTAFNLRNYPARRKGVLKYSSLTERLGLYSPRPGSVSLSGWQTILGQLPETQFVDWIPSTAVLFRREVFNHYAFDEFFDDYSYLEDLDFSFTLSRVGRLAVVAGAGFSHFPSTSGRITARIFGRYEVRNRLYFVRKHCLSVSRCYLGLVIRFAMSIASGLANLNATLLLRALGNIEEVMRQSVTPFTTTPVTPSR